MIRNFGQEWQFSRDGVQWTPVEIPHDWAVEGPFARENDRQYTHIVQDGETVDHELNGRTGGLPHTGTGFYRKTFSLENPEKVFLEFDGAMSHSSVKVNGIDRGGCNFGYTSFRLDVSDACRNGSNTVEVTLHNPASSSRWYPGAGIYREVRIRETGAVYFAFQGASHRAVVSGDSAELVLSLEIQNDTGAETTRKLEIEQPELIGHRDFEVNLMPGLNIVEKKFTVSGFRKWELEDPTLYPVSVRLEKDGLVMPLGFRTVEFDPDRGFLLNGRRVKINGVCMHHDLGPLGAAFHRTAAKRQLLIMKDMGANAIRTSHNPPDPALLDLCDELGILVMDEAFDAWRLPKLENDYHLHFDADSEKDLSSLVRRDRNHPCVILWSIGNEIPDQSVPEGGETAKRLCSIVKKWDGTRPVSAGFDRPWHALENGLAEAVDVPGWNYKPFWYNDLRQKLPGKCMIGSETLSTVSSRGVYHFPAEERVVGGDNVPYDLQCSAYALDRTSWATLMEREFQAQHDFDFIAGQFIWTGFDYLGEPTPFNEQWPARSSYFGCVDLVGLPKDLFYGIQAEWKKNTDVLHLMPHWNWQGKNGQIIDVQAFSNCEKVELFLNDVSMGCRSKLLQSSNPVDRYRFSWKVPYVQGRLEAVGFRGEKEVARTVVETAGEPAKISLEMEADYGSDMKFVVASVTDSRGIVCPLDSRLVNFAVEGAFRIVAADAGNAASTENFQKPECHLFSGKAVVYLKRTGNGKTTLSAVADGLKSACLEF